MPTTANIPDMFLLQSVGETLDSTTQAYMPIRAPTFPDNANSPTANAWLFCQDISADPASPMAQQFVQMGTRVMQTAQSATDIETAVNGFFHSTQYYQNVTLDSYISVNTYLYTHANAWANFSPSYIYYLYADSSNSGGPLTPAGKVVLTQQPLQGNSVPVTDSQGNANANGNYAIHYYRDDKDTTGTPLYFSFAMLVSSLTDAVPAICFQCTYYPLFKLTLSNGDIGTNVPILFGNVNGQKLFAVNMQHNANQIAVKAINLENQEGSQDSNAEAGAWSWWEVMLTVVGCIVGIALLFIGIYKLKERLRIADEEAFRQASEETQERVQEAIKRLDELNKQKDDWKEGEMFDDINKIEAEEAARNVKDYNDGQHGSSASLFREDDTERMDASRNEAQDMLNRMSGAGDVSEIPSENQLSNNQQDIQIQRGTRSNELLMAGEEEEIMLEQSQILEESKYGASSESQQEYAELENLLNQLEGADSQSSATSQILKQDQQEIESVEEGVINEGQQMQVTLSKQEQQQIVQDKQFEEGIETDVKEDQAEVKEDENSNEYEDE